MGKLYVDTFILILKFACVPSLWVSKGDRRKPIIRLETEKPRKTPHPSGLTNISCSEVLMNMAVIGEMVANANLEESINLLVIDT